MPQTALTVCPHCQAQLVAAESVERCLCPRCQGQFVHARTLAAARVSRKAIWSLVLGIGSIVLMLPAGIASLVFGILALRDMHRQSGRLKGRALAVTGMIVSVLCGLTCSPWMLISTIDMVMKVRLKVDTQRPKQVVRFAETLGIRSVPERLQPLRAENDALLQFSYVAYGRKEGHGHVELLIFVERPSRIRESALLNTAQDVAGAYGLKLQNETIHFETVEAWAQSTALHRRVGVGLDDQPLTALQLVLTQPKTNAVVTWMRVGDAGDDPQWQERFLSFVEAIEHEAAKQE